MNEDELRAELAKLLSLKEVAAELGLVESSLRARIHRGDPDTIPIARFTGPVFTRAQVDRLKELGHKTPGPKPGAQK